MHEWALAESILTAAMEAAEKEKLKKITEIKIGIGELQQIEQESVLQVRDAWLDHFLDRITCPKCNKQLHHMNGKIWCEDNHFETKY